MISAISKFEQEGLAEEAKFKDSIPQEWNANKACW
jgi:hypothetical protein